MRKAQSALEYALVVVAVIAALLAMQNYLSRAMQGRLKGVADQLGEHYSPQHTTSDITTNQTSNITVQTNTTETEGGIKFFTESTTTINDETQHQTGTETINPD